MLYDFQIEGANFLAERTSAILADEMGLGKTRQAIQAALTCGAQRILVVCPATLKYNWRREILDYVPGESVKVVQNGKDGDFSAKWSIINYDLLGKHLEKLTGFDIIIFDESHYLKNTRTQRAKNAFKVRSANHFARFWLLTGTPVLNRPAEIVGQLCVLNKLRGRMEILKFLDTYCYKTVTRWGTEYSGLRNAERLKSWLSAFVLRRRKREVLSLPAKRRVTLDFPIDNVKDYLTALGEVSDVLDGKASEGTSQEKVTALARLTKLRRLSAVGKVAAATEWIESFLECGRKLIVFGHHLEALDGLREAFRDVSVSISSDMTPTERAEAVRRFQEEKSVRLVIVGLRVGAEGVTLTAASDVLFLEADWTPGRNQQAEDRAHRIGQNESVTCWYSVGCLPDGRETIDRAIFDTVSGKSTIITQLLGDGATEGVFL